MSRTLLLLIFVFCAAPNFAFEIDHAFVGDISKRGEFWTAQLSPDGKRIAVGVRLRNDTGRAQRGVHVFDLKESKIVNSIGFADGSHVDSVLWLTDKRLLFSIRKNSKFSESGYRSSRFVMMNFDGSNRVDDFGSFEGQIDERTIVTSYFDRDARRIKFDLSDIYGARVRGKLRSKVSKPPFLGQGIFSLSGNPKYKDELRYFYGIDSNSRSRLSFYRGFKKGWTDVDLPFKHASAGYGWYPRGVLADGRVLIQGTLDGDVMDSLFAVNPENGDVERLFSDAESDPTAIYLREGRLIAVETERHYPKLHIIDDEHPAGQILAAIAGAFPNHGIGSVSFSEDHDKVLFSIYAGSEPNKYLLFDVQSGSLQEVFVALDHIDRELLRPMEAVEITARDGLALPAYLTFPAGSEKNNPLVIIPHGGPRSRDYWGFDSETQLLAHHGFAVLQVNFRGSDGFGLEFMRQGDGEWGRKIQYDLIDAVNWAISEGYADKDRIAIVGASFGGYSALQSATLAPDLFKAAVGYVGVYDLPMLYKKGDIAGKAGNHLWDQGGKYLLDEMLVSAQIQHEQSPINRANLLKTPVLFVHGEDDVRAPIDHTYRMMEAMDKYNKPYETLFRDGEGHGFVSEENREDYFLTLLKFLQNHLSKSGQEGSEPL